MPRKNGLARAKTARGEAKRPATHTSKKAAALQKPKAPHGPYAHCRSCKARTCVSEPSYIVKTYTPHRKHGSGWVEGKETSRSAMSGSCSSCGKKVFTYVKKSKLPESK